MSRKFWVWWRKHFGKDFECPILSIRSKIYGCPFTGIKIIS